jgi:NADH-quinone oxidoreductase subunit L
MLGIVTFVALGIQVYSLKYMQGDQRFGWYFAVHALFAASMLTLVLADNLILLYIAWELVGLCSYLLIGHWYERRPAAEAAKKAFVTTRLGDVGLLIGIILFWRATGTFQFSELFETVQAGRTNDLPKVMSDGYLTLATLLVFLGAMGKSAQVPFHVWLPDAMEGPTPVSALIHAATMVAAGVYLVARTYPLFLAAPQILTLITWVGAVTALLAATLALAETDIKRVLAYSTVSQLGYMMAALGAGALFAGYFHLITHGFFKALLFLAAGAVIHAVATNDLARMGRLGRAMPKTATAFVVGALALATFLRPAVFETWNWIFTGAAALAGWSGVRRCRATLATLGSKP